MRHLGSVRRVWARAGLAGSVVVGALLGVPGAAGAIPGGVTPARTSPATCTWIPHLLPQLAGGSGGFILGNDGGSRWVGAARTGGGMGHAVLWQHGRITDLSRPTESESVARDVNRQEVVVGTSDYADPGSDNGFSTHATMWRGTGAIRLAEPAGTFSSQASGINDAGLIAGWTTLIANGSTSYHPLVWSAAAPGRVQDLGTPPTTSTLLNDVSDSGMLVGVLASGPVPADTGTAVVGTVRSGLHPLPSAGLAYTEATVAAGRWIAGLVFDPSVTETTAARWDDRRGPVVQVEAPIVPTGINLSGTIVGNGFNGARVWSANTVTRLSGPAGGATSAGAINEDDTIGGYSYAPFGTVDPTLWSCR